MQGWIGSNVNLNRYAGWEVCEGAGVVGPGGVGVEVVAHWNLLIERNPNTAELSLSDATASPFER